MKHLLGLIFCVCFFLCASNAATTTVTKTADTNDGICDADCSLREAISSSGGGDTIEFSSLFNTQQTIVLSGSELPLIKSINIAGPGADLLTISGNNVSRIFNISGAATNLIIKSLTIADGGAVCNGGGVFIMNATVTLQRVHLTNNTALVTGSNCTGGAIENRGTLKIESSTLSANISNNGGAIQNGSITFTATLTMLNSTISGNTADVNGGAIQNGRILTLTSCTITNNTSAGYSGINNGFLSNTTIRNTIVAANALNTDVFGNYFSDGFNLIGNGDGATGLTQPTDQVGNAIIPVNPLLGALANNGGATKTHNLFLGSPTIDKGNAFAETLDQRGLPRTIDNPSASNVVGGDATDIGAFELQTPTAALVSVSGRILTSSGRGLSKAIVSITDMNGVTRTALTSSFGYYQFDDLSAGETYIFNIASKRYGFSPQVFNLNENLTGFDFIVQELHRE